MNKEEAKAKITAEFITRYNQWLEDKDNLPEIDYARKYPTYSERIRTLKDNFTAVAYFQSNVYNGKWKYQWVNEGYDFSDLMQLVREGFLSITEYTNRYKHPDTARFYLSQKTAKEIWKQDRNK